MKLKRPQIDFGISKGKVSGSFNVASDLVPLIKALNPLEAIGRTIVEMGAVRAEIKRIETEYEKVKKQFSVIDAELDRTFQYKIAVLENEKEMLLKYFEKIDSNSLDQRVTTDRLRTALDNAIKEMGKISAREPLPEIHYLEVYGDIIQRITNALVTMQERSVQDNISMGNTIQKMIQDTKMTLKQLPSISHMLPASYQDSFDSE